MNFKNNKEIHKFDTIGNRFEFYYNEVSDSFFVFDKLLNKKTDLEIKVRKYKEFKEVKEQYGIRYLFPKPHNIGTRFYIKSLSVIKFKLFGEYKGTGGSPLSLTDDVCKKIVKKKYEDLGFLLGYTEMIQSEEPLLRKVYSYMSNNGGLSKYIELTSELGINTTLYFKDHKDVFLKSSFEFIFFSILHFNQIEYQYEPFKVGTYVPDFYIPKKNILIEILGLSMREYYSKKSKIKEELYKTEGYNYKPIIVDRHHPKESIFNGCEEIFGKLKLPNFNDYSRKYILKSDEFINNVKSYLTDINEGKLKVSVRKDKSGFREKHRYYYNYVLETYGNIQIGIKELIGIPSRKFKGVKIEKYWKNIDYVKDELENVFKNEKRIPTKWESRTSLRKTYNLWNFYRFWGEKSLKKGGLFFEFLEELKLKYGYDDINERKEDELQRTKDELHKNLIIYLNGINDGKWNTKTKSSEELGLHGKYPSQVERKYGNIFNGVKELIGFPNPRVIRYSYYYDSIENCKYEISENIKRFGYLPTSGEVRRPPLLGNNSIRGVYEKYGVKEFQKGGIFYEIIMDSLKLYGKK